MSVGNDRRDTTTEIFLIAMGIIFTVPYVIWRVLRTDYSAPLVVVQIILTVPIVTGRLRRASELIFKAA